MIDPIERLADLLEQHAAGFLLVITGAGISAASGLPTFRGTDPGAIWSSDVTEIGTFGFFQRDPVQWWSWFRDRFAGLENARPNPAHYALAAIERWQLEQGGRFLLVTQNVDMLHERAGSVELIKIHGSSDRVRCSRPGCVYGSPSGFIPRDDVDFEPFLAEPTADRLPRCPACGSWIRAHALLFDEFYTEHADYGFERAQDALASADLVLFAGTSFSVGLTELALRAVARRRIPAMAIDPAADAPQPIVSIRAPAEQVLPEVFERLAGSSG